MSEDQGPPTRAQRKYLSRSIASLFVALDDVHADMSTHGEVQDKTRQQLQSELATVIVQLRQWRDETHVNWQQATPFDEGPDGLLAQLLDGDEGYERPQGERNAKRQKVNKPARIGVDTLYTATLDIVDIAKQLGLTSEIEGNHGTRPAQSIRAAQDESYPGPMQPGDGE
jgi:hypothetical protein